MAFFRCKMCGGTLELGTESVGVCEYCGTRQTLPRLDSERKAALYDRASHFRANNDFDKAAGIYEQILGEDNRDAEAYWSLVLCRFGIEYVEDPASRRRIPTVNRTQLTSVFDDENYRAALHYADMAQWEIYEQEAQAINSIQKGILAISQKEDPFDVFICYKETDAGGRRTMDSVLAQDLYTQLTQNGFKVFFSRITLEDKLGTAYEPYIFAALNSAKVMVVLGTRPEHLQAVWVKNEWSRYLAMIRGGAQKVLIPAYRDMDPYSLPEEFSHLQAQDMSKLGFMQDLIRGIQKIISGSAEGKASVAPLLKRVHIFLEDGDWRSADEYCEKVLDIDPENAQAYLGKLMAQLQVNRPVGLAYCPVPFDNSNYYHKVVRYGDPRLVAEINGYLEAARKNSGQPQPMPLAPPRHAPEETPVSERKSAERPTQYKQRLVLAVGGVALAICMAIVLNFGTNIFAHTHTWQEATCEKGRVCEECGETEGEPLDHLWLNASEDRPKTCTRCGATEGISLGEQKQRAYNAAMKDAKALVEARKYVKAVQALSNIYKEYGDTQSYDLMVECRRKQGTFNSSVVAAGKDNTVVISDGTIRVEGDTRFNETLGTGWDNIAGVAMGDKHLVCLQTDGTVVTVGDNYDKQQTGIKGLRNVVAIAAGDFHSVALLADGTLRASEGYDHCGQCSVDELMYAAGDRQIVAISAAYDHTLALLEDGRVVACGDQKATNNTPNGACNVGWWTDVVAICSGSEFSAGLRMDGTVMLSGVDWDVSGWTDIVNIAAGDYYLVGVRENGQVVAVGNSGEGNSYTGYGYLSGLKNIVYVAAGHDHTVAVDKSGKVHCVGSNSRGQCELDGLSLFID